MATNQHTPGTYANHIAFYMTPETARDLLEQSRARRAAELRKRAVQAARAALYVEKRVPGAERRVINWDGTLGDELVERRMIRRRALDLDMMLP